MSLNFETRFYIASILNGFKFNLSSSAQVSSPRYQMKGGIATIEV